MLAPAVFAFGPPRPPVHAAARPAVLRHVAIKAQASNITAAEERDLAVQENAQKITDAVSSVIEVFGVLGDVWQDANAERVAKQ